MTMREVAERAGVSIKTVSRVVNGERNVSEKITLSVRQAIEALDYTPNAAARALRTGASDTIGVVVDSFHDPFFSSMLTVFEDRSLAMGFDIVVASSGRQVGRCHTQLQRLLQRQLSGLLIAPVPELDASRFAVPGDLPVVFFDRRADFEGYDAVLVQDLTGTLEAIRHLIAHGHSRIAFIADTALLSTVRDRIAGYQAALAEADIAVDPTLICTAAVTSKRATAVTHELLRRELPPTAIFAATPLVGEGVISALATEAALDVALVVFGELPMADALVPGVTVIEHNPVGLAHAAMDRLFAHIDGRDAYRADVVLPTRLIQRGSGELPPRSSTARLSSPRSSTPLSSL